MPWRWILAIGAFSLAVSASGLGLLLLGASWALPLALFIDVLMLCLALTGALCCKAALRVFWVGFFVFGLGYWVSRDTHGDTLFTEVIAQHLPFLQPGPIDELQRAQWIRARNYAARVSSMDGRNYYVAPSDSGTVRVVASSNPYSVMTTQTEYGGFHFAIWPLVACAGALVGVFCFGRHREGLQHQTAGITNPQSAIYNPQST